MAYSEVLGDICELYMCVEKLFAVVLIIVTRIINEYYIWINVDFT